MGGKKRVAILTPSFTEFKPGYSLTGIVTDQATMLARHGHPVDIFVGETFNDPKYAVPEGVRIIKALPWARLIDYATEQDFGKIKPDDFTEEDLLDHIACPGRTTDLLNKMEEDYDIFFTHDWVYTGWHLPSYLGLRSWARQPRGFDSVKSFHWVHSMPFQRYDWWNIGDLGRNHKIVFPNKSYREIVAEAFRGTWEDVKTIPHIKDIRVLHRFQPESWEFIDKYPGLLQAEVIQVYPASADRLTTKRVREVILIFKEIKKLGFSVCLVIANQWATVRQRKEDADEYKNIGYNNGLSPKELIFTSDFKPEWEVGVPQEILIDFMRCSNLFIFPTVAESFGLVLPEVILSGGVLPVLNADLDVLTEITHGRGLRFPFGAFNRQLNHMTSEDDYMKGIAAVIMDRMREEESLASKSIIRKYLNMDYLYDQVYHPAMEGSAAW